jgi:hypothetical protein
MFHIYEVETDADPVWDVYQDADTYGPADYRESFETHNDLATFLDKCDSDGVEYILYRLTDWDTHGTV